MMQPLTLKEFAENLRITGDWREMEFADEILELIELEDEVAEPYSELCGDLEQYAPDKLKDEPAKAVEWLGDRSNLLAEIEELLKGAGLTGDVDDVVKTLLMDLTECREVLAENGLREYDL